MGGPAKTYCPRFAFGEPAAPNESAFGVIPLDLARAGAISIRFDAASDRAWRCFCRLPRRSDRSAWASFGAFSLARMAISDLPFQQQLLQGRCLTSNPVASLERQDAMNVMVGTLFDGGCDSMSPVNVGSGSRRSAA